MRILRGSDLWTYGTPRYAATSILIEFPFAHQFVNFEWIILNESRACRCSPISNVNFGSYEFRNQIQTETISWTTHYLSSSIWPTDCIEWHSISLYATSTQKPILFQFNSLSLCCQRWSFLSIISCLADRCIISHLFK